MKSQGKRRGLPISRAAKDRFGIVTAPSPKAPYGEPELNYREAEAISAALNNSNRADRYPELTISPATVFALGLIRSAQRLLIREYSRARGGKLLPLLLEKLEKQPGSKALDSTFNTFLSDFLVEGIPERPDTVEELILLWLSNKNPAAGPMRDLFSDSELKHRTAYRDIISSSYIFLSQFPGFGPGNLHLIDLLRSPAIAHPDNLLDQLEFIRTRWGDLLGDFLTLLLRGIDYLKEESKAHFPPGPGPSIVPSYAGGLEEYERFSSDSHWMPEVVLIAKSTLVWLDQISKRYKREVRRLNEIPDEELDMLAHRGFNALWLIGIWERSDASRRIKQWNGNAEAAASAYSLKRYEIADELGGWEALGNLRYRCSIRGIRLASDMVPNHTGLDSDWLFEHPEWFIQCGHPPFPAYTYNGESIVDNHDFGVRLEDHYWDRTDAAVTFKFEDHRNGQVRYIYHGNDGTSMPWNDTAQLDYLNPVVREVVIQTIIHVARNFPIIRFDAAMTLAKKHIQRLWYPEPGHGGDIASRSRFGISGEEFHKQMPEEFWREVVDRVAAEAPDTLLLAEAFWMMEGYFVRTLGMHRVYNSAFMNMLKNEDNAEYRQTIKNTLEYDPEILKRFVNFMNNPDEDTAYSQFGDGDKYFGVCTMMTAMPGLPMFGHGQIEGFREKYGMEFRKAYLDEQPDQNLIDRHEREIFPLARIRRTFAEVENFLFYDFFDAAGGVNENVFVWSNRNGLNRAVIAFNNSYHSTHGSFRHSAPVGRKGENGEKKPETSHLAAGLGLQSGENWFTIFRELHSDLWFIRESALIHREGMKLVLAGYQTQVFLNIHEVHDNTGLYRKLHDMLRGAGVPDIERTRRELYAAPARDPFRRLITTERIESVYAMFAGANTPPAPRQAEDDLAADYRLFLEGCRSLGYGSEEGTEAALEAFREAMKTLHLLAELNAQAEKPLPSGAAGYFIRGLSIIREAPLLLYARALLSPVVKLLEGSGPDPEAAADTSEMIGELLIPSLFGEALRNCGVPEHYLYEPELLIRLLPRLEEWYPGETDGSAAASLEKILALPEVSAYCGINEHRGIRWYKGETLQQFFWWLAVLTIPGHTEKGFELIRRWHLAEEGADYRLDQLLELLEG